MRRRRPTSTPRTISRRMLGTARETARRAGRVDPVGARAPDDRERPDADRADDRDVRPAAERRTRRAAGPFRGRALLERPGAAERRPGDRVADVPGVPPATRRSSAGRAASSRPRGGTVLRTVVPFRNRERVPRVPRSHPPHQRHPDPRPHARVGAGVDEPGSGLDGRRQRGADARCWSAPSPRRPVRRPAAAAALRDDGAADRGRRPRAARAGRGSDTISWLAREFNTMADSVTGLVGEVRNQRERLETVINSIDDGIVVLDAHAPGDRRQRRVPARDGRPARGTCWAAAAARRDRRACATSRDCPTLGLPADRRAPGAHLRAAHAPTARVRVGGDPRLPDSRRRRQACAHVVEVWRDISERRAAEARLAESHRLASLGLLASGFSHELNTPLATVLTCVEGILREVAGPTPAGGATRGADRRERRHRARPGAALPRHHAALPPHVARPGLARRHRGPARRRWRPPRGWWSRPRARPAPWRSTRRAGRPARASGRGGAAARADQSAAERRAGLQARRDGRASASRAATPVRIRVSRRRVRHPARAPEADLRAVLQHAEGRHRPGAVPLARTSCGGGAGTSPSSSAAGRRVRPSRSRCPRSPAQAAEEVPRVKATPSVLLVDDDDVFRTVMARRAARGSGFEVATAGVAAQSAAGGSRAPAGGRAARPAAAGHERPRGARRRCASACPAAEVIMLTGHGSIDTAIEAIRDGGVRLRRQALPARRARGADPAGARAAVAAHARQPARARADAARSRAGVHRARARRSSSCCS